MNTININNSLMLIIDVQEKLVNMITDSKVKENAIKLAKTTQIINLETIVTEQYPKGLGSTIDEIKIATQNATYIKKTYFSGYEEIKNILKVKNKKQIILWGIEAHICVLQTAFDLINNGYEVFIVEDASGCRNKNDKKVALQRLRHAGCQTVTTEMVIFELLKYSKHPNFKEVQSLIK